VREFFADHLAATIAAVGVMLHTARLFILAFRDPDAIQIEQMLDMVREYPGSYPARRFDPVNSRQRVEPPDHLPRVIIHIM
jgi:hypothetical protein